MTRAYSDLTEGSIALNAAMSSLPNRVDADRRIVLRSVESVFGIFFSVSSRILLFMSAVSRNALTEARFLVRPVNAALFATVAARLADRSGPGADVTPVLGSV